MRTFAHGSWADRFRVCMCWAVIAVANAVPAASAATATAFKPVPAITFTNLDGAPVTLSSFRGRVVLINFWGTWCAPCLKEIPELVRLSRDLTPHGLEVVGIAVDSGQPEDIREFVIEHEMQYHILIGDLGVVKKRFQVFGFPTSLLVDRKGMIRKRYFGPQTETNLKRDVEQLLE